MIKLNKVCDKYLMGVWKNQTSGIMGCKWFVAWCKISLETFDKHCAELYQKYEYTLFSSDN